MKKKDRVRVEVYLLERRSMLLSGREKSDSSVQKESDMLTARRHHRRDNAAMLGGGRAPRADAGFLLTRR